MGSFMFRKFATILIAVLALPAFADISSLKMTKSCEDCDFTAQSLVFADLSGTNITYSSFEQADLSNSDFSDAFLNYVCFKGAKLRGADFQRSTLHIFGCRVPGRAKHSLKKTEAFRNADLRGSNFSSAKMNFSEKMLVLEAQLSGVNFSQAQFAKTRLYSTANIKQTNVKFNAAIGELHLRGIFDNADFRNFRGNIYVAKSANENCWGSFTSEYGYNYEDPICDVQTVIKNSNFDGAVLSGSKFYGVDLAGSTFRGANLQNVNFENANLRNADFTGADLRGAKIKNTNLCEAISPDGTMLFVGCD